MISRRISLDAIATDRSTASRADLFDGLRGLALDLPLGFLGDVRGVGHGLVLEFLPEPIGVGARAGQQVFGVHARLREELAGVLLRALELLARLAGVVDGGGDRLLPLVERLEQRLPGELAQQERPARET